jgi:hypothetical protein
MTQHGREELRPYLRDERPPDNSIIVVRGGPSTLAKLAMHARRTQDAYGLDGLLRRFASYRVVHLPHASQLRSAGFQLLPSFGRPHYTVRLAGDDQAELTRLLDVFGPVQANKYHR